MAPPAHAFRVEKKKKPLKRWDPHGVVTLLAAGDEDANPLTIHKEVVCYYSPIFRAAFNSRFKEGETQEYRIEDTSQRMVKLLIHWLYFQEIDLGIVKYEQKSTADQTLVELWVLGDKFFIPSLQNAAIQEIERLRKRYRTTSTQCLEYIWDKTVQGSPLRKLFLEYCAFNIRSTRFLERPEHFPKEMLLELAELMMEIVQDTTKEARTAARKISDYMVEEEKEDEE